MKLTVLCKSNANLIWQISQIFDDKLGINWILLIAALLISLFKNFISCGCLFDMWIFIVILLNLVKAVHCNLAVPPASSRFCSSGWKWFATWLLKSVKLWSWPIQEFTREQIEHEHVRQTNCTAFFTINFSVCLTFLQQKLQPRHFLQVLQFHHMQWKGWTSLLSGPILLMVQLALHNFSMGVS